MNRYNNKKRDRENMRIKTASGIIQGQLNGEKREEMTAKLKTTHTRNTGVVYYGHQIVGQSGFLTELISEEAILYLSNHFDELYKEPAHQVKKKFIDHITESIEGANIESFCGDCSVLFAAVNGNRYIAGQLGKGMILLYQEQCKILSRPKGEGTKVDPWSPLALPENRLQMYRGTLEEPYGFMIISGGASLSLSNQDYNTISPACPTFFSWMKDFHEDDVSQALIENMVKYFNKNTQDEIGVALLLCEKEEALMLENQVNLEEESIENQNNPGDSWDEEVEQDRLLGWLSGKNGFRIKILIGVLVLAIAGLLVLHFVVPGSDISNSSEENPTETVLEGSSDLQRLDQDDNQGEGSNSADVITDAALDNPVDEDMTNPEPSVTFSVESPLFYEPGFYRIGRDIPEGEYFIWTGDMLQPDTVEIDGETCLSNELYCMTIEVEDGQTLSSDYRFTAAENVNPVKSTNGTLISGKYKIGKDIAPGTYYLLPETDWTGRYYSVWDGEIDNKTEIIAPIEVTVPDQGYIVLYHAVLEL